MFPRVLVVTLYATLGEEAIAYGINEAEVTHVIISGELLPKLKVCVWGGGWLMWDGSGSVLWYPVSKILNIKNIFCRTS